MADQPRPVDAQALQFDRVIEDGSIGSLLRDRTGATCEMCGHAIDIEYYQVNAKVVCGSCRGALEAGLQTPRGIVPFSVRPPSASARASWARSSTTVSSHCSTWRSASSPS